MKRIASCSCGALRATVMGEPVSVVACHCLDCQRRSGSVFGLGAYYAKNHVSIEGTYAEFRRPTDAGHEFVTHFCPACGTSLFWYSGKNPGMLGVAVGAFGDPTFESPHRSVWEQSKHEWSDVDVAKQHFEKGRE